MHEGKMKISEANTTGKVNTMLPNNYKMQIVDYIVSIEFKQLCHAM